ncbi:MAG TPA: SPW repeat protein [Pyrinomonadaceae bacterium]|nr:SPW repeat protein [Pyrinomonadaceae bacterium]
MAIREEGQGAAGGGQGLGVDVGAQAGEGTLLGGENEPAGRAEGVVNAVTGALSAGPKPLKPLPHGVLDYAMAGTLMAAPWLFGFSRNRKATVNAVVSGAAVLGLSLMTRYPLGAVKKIPFTTHGVIETLSAVMTAAAPWTMGFAHDRGARTAHVMSGLATLGVVAMTDYRAADQPGGADTPSLEEVTSAVSDLASSVGDLLPEALNAGGGADQQTNDAPSVAAGAGGD